MVFSKTNHASSGYAAVAKLGFYAALLVIVVCFLVFFFFLQDAMKQRANDLGFLNSSHPFLELSLIIVLILSVLFFLTFLVGTALGALFRK